MEIELSEIFKALGDPTRLGIMQLLTGKEMCVCEIIEASDKSQPAISRHLKIMKQAGLLSEAREGKWVMYSIRPPVVTSAANFLQAFACETLVRIEPGNNCVELRNPKLIKHFVESE